MSDRFTEKKWGLRFGASVRDGDSVEFRVWAPNLTKLAVRVMGGSVGEHPRTIPMKQSSDSEFVATVSQVGEGADYFTCSMASANVLTLFRAGSRAACTVLPASSIPRRFRWSDQGWSGIPLKNFIIYELHTGTFTREGTFESVIPRLPYLRDLGITAIEIMPVAEVPGNRNWGYDGASLYAPQSSYGGPTGLKKLVDACHQHGLAVVLDVVYNHLGPEGNYLPEFAPCFTDTHHTPWGKAINFDGPESDGVRRFIIDNALYWLTEYHVDALRLDAIHGIYDFGARHILDELSQAFQDQARSLQRQAWLIAESDLEDVAYHQSPRSGRLRARRAVARRFSPRALCPAHRPKAKAFSWISAPSPICRSPSAKVLFSTGNIRAIAAATYGSSSKDRPGEQFVDFIQNHDQIANTSRGKRLSSLVSAGQQKLAAVLTLCSPFLPLLFMGEEYGETAPFLYFTSFDDPGSGCGSARRAEKRNGVALLGERVR